MLRQSDIYFYRTLLANRQIMCPVKLASIKLASIQPVGKPIHSFGLPSINYALPSIG